MSWSTAYKKVARQVEDTLELRNSFLEFCLLDERGEPIKQAPIHLETQQALYEWDMQGVTRGLMLEPYGSGKSQQVCVGLSPYFLTLNPEESHLIVTAAPSLAEKRIIAIRNLIKSPEYKTWCADHGLAPLEFSADDNDSKKVVYVKSKNRTGNPSIEATGIDTGGTGQRCNRLFGDDICDKKDFSSPAVRESRYKSWTNTWTKRVYDGGRIYVIGTPYHPEDANMKLIDSGTYKVIEIAVNADKSGYTVKKEGQTYTIPLWERNHSKAKLEIEEKEDPAAYGLGYRMLREVQDPSNSTYMDFSDADYPAGNVGDFRFRHDLPTPWELTCDFNVSPMSWSLMQFQEGKYVCLEELIGRNLTTEAHAMNVAKTLLELNITYLELYGDGTSNQGGARYGRSGENDWKTVCRVLDKHGISWAKKVKKSNPLRNERIKVVNSVIYSQLSAERRLLIDRKCTTIIEDYKFSVRDGEELKKKKQGARGHISDAVDYRVYRGEKLGSFSMLIK